MNATLPARRRPIGLFLLAFLALNTGVYSLRYLLPGSPQAATLDNLHLRHGWLLAHAGFASIALLVGPWQFFSRIRSASWRLHAWLGRAYCIAVTAGWIASIPTSLHAQTGAVASSGFLVLGLFWIFTTAFAWRLARDHRYVKHQQWMIRSYALTAAAITLRIYLPLSIVSRIPFDIAYPVIAWLCWTTNLIDAEVIIHRRRAASAPAIE